jgi:dihydroneopterin aldolase
MEGTPEADIICISELQLPGVLAPDSFSRDKEQPATVSVSLTLRPGFSTAANKDELDASTIHYGELAKRIRGNFTSPLKVFEAFAKIEEDAIVMATKDSGRFILAKLVIELELPKMSMAGKGVAMRCEFQYNEDAGITGLQWVYSLREVQVMAIIGINDHERKNKQPLLVSCEVFHKGEQPYGLERDLVEVSLFGCTKVRPRLIAEQIIEGTSYGTLESLAAHTIEKMRSKVPGGGSRVRLRLAKLRAIAFAEASAVEVVRTFGDGKA